MRACYPKVRPSRSLFCGVFALALSGCGSVPYYSQAVAGELALLAAARPVPEVIADPATPPDIRDRLQLAVRIRAFASDQLSLPDNPSYKRYSDLHRSSAVWNVFATPPFSLELHTWCYPFFGCAGYRGYFEQAAADREAAELRAQGLDAAVAPVPAYSTLGWFADPLLSTFIRWSEPELARLIFHELAHQIVYVADDTRFNESFATAVEQVGLERWVASRHDAALTAEFAQYRERHAGFLELMAQTRSALEALYGSAGRTPEQMQGAKAQIFDELRGRYRAMRDGRWSGYPGFDAFFNAPWNNARVAALAAYQDEVPAFNALLARERGSLPAFFTEVVKLGQLPADMRARALRSLTETSTS
jgi:predicted aminopeptidase